ncbi:MAG: histidine kinase [Thermoanaerobaculia bacterium]|nr:histidine kinase [Thermoanaerobaculia bacterium]
MNAPPYAGEAPAALPRLGLGQWAAVWATLATLSACWLLTAEASQQGGARWDRSVVINLGSLLLWALLSAPLVRVARRHPLHGDGAAAPRRRLRGLALKAALALACALAHVVLLTFVLVAMLPFDLRLESYRPLLEHTLRHNLHFDLLIAALVLFADESLGWYRRFEQRRVETARLAEQVATERLAAARLRLRPSFVFRALDAIARAIPADARRAEQMVLRLAALLRALLESGGEGAASAREELDFARAYLEVEQGRIGARLTWELDAEPAALASELPRLTLQPLLEAAVEALERRGEPAKLTLRLRGEAERLRVELDAAVAGDASPLDVATLGDALAAARARVARLRPAADLRVWCERPSAGRVLAGFELVEPTAAETNATAPGAPSEEVVWSRS